MTTPKSAWHSARVYVSYLFCWLLAFPGSAAGQSGPPSDEVSALLERYVEAWESLNPFNLIELSPLDSKVFVPLLEDDRFDQIRRASVQLSDIEVFGEGEEEEFTVRFTKRHEELFHVGTLTRGLARVEMTLRRTGARHEITSHEIVGQRPSPQEPRHRSANPSTWRNWPVEGERSFYLAYQQLLHGELKRASTTLTQLLSEPKTVLVPGVNDYTLGNNRFMAQLHYFLALCSLRLNESEIAERNAATALALHPEFPLALNLLAERAANRGEITTALSWWRRSVKVAPEQARVTARIRFYDAALSHYPEGPLRDKYISTRDLPYAHAESVLHELLRMDRSNVETRRRLAALRLLNYEPAGAEKVLMENLYHHANDLETLYLLGRAALALSRPDDALRYFDQVWSKAPLYRDTLTYLTDIHTLRGQHRAATRYLTEALERRESDPLVLYKLGVSAQKASHRLEAMDFLRRAQRAQPPASIRPALHDLLTDV